MTDPGLTVPRWQRRLLPASMADAHSTRRTPRDWIVDATMLLIAIGIGAAVLAETRDDHSEAARIADIALGVAACVALWWRRSRPVAVAVATMVLSIVSAAAAGAGLLALFNAALRAPRRTLGPLALLALAGAALFPLVYPGADSYGTQILVGVLLTGIVVGWGLFVRVRRELVRSLHERAERLEAEQRARVEAARDAERRRIAREMHDVLAHRLSLLSVHAGALEFNPAAPPEEIKQAAGVIRGSAHAALQELREVIGVLRAGEAEDASEPPQPTLADVPALVEESRAAGMRAYCKIEVDGAEVPDAVGRTIYRVVQEGLTNARKHAPYAAVEVSVTGGVRAVELVRAGDSMLSPAVTRRLISLVAGDGRTDDRRERARALLERLSQREREVALAVGRGSANADIAAELHMSVATVKAHVSRLLTKLEVSNRVQIALLVQDAAG